ncbi:MAG: GspE/PulE family protein [Candidatus Andersenbacteria bacterium]|nr:GspE/PulE family protein [Candidatus Andersenbacteria bacterium]
MAEGVDEKVLHILVELQKISAEDAARAIVEAKEGKETLKNTLIGKFAVGEEDYAKAYANAMSLSYVDLRSIQIKKEVLEIIPESTARQHMVIAYDKTDAGLLIAMEDPADRQIIEFIHKKVDVAVIVSIASSSAIRDVFPKYAGSLEADLDQIMKEARGVRMSNTDTDLSKVAEDLPIIKIVDAVLRHAIGKDASDIHIEPTEDAVVVRYRIDGILHDMMVLPKTVLAGVVARIKILSNLKIDEHRLPQDGRFKMESDDYNVAFRVSTLPVFDGEKIVMRLLDESGNGLTIDRIGLSKRNIDMFRNNIAKPNGMILVTGPTGSGKTTTLYAVLRELNTKDVNISTIEDPIEYRMKRVNQTQVQPKIGLTFSNGLRALVRQDPDIIMVGEIRDQETASLAVNAALTGHLVLSTLHTNSATGAIPRLMDMKVEPFLLASTINVVVAQRLVRQLCDSCKKEVRVTDAMKTSIADIVDADHMLELLKQEGVVQGGGTWEDVSLFEAVGCDRCHEGYKSRKGIHEMFEMTPSLQKMVTGNITAHELETAAREEQGMVSMLEDGIIKVARGITSLEEVLRVAKE